MALTDENMSTTMLVQPSGGMNYGNMGGGIFGNDGLWLLLVLLLGGGWGGFGGFGMGGMMGAGMLGMDMGFGLYPWLNNSQNINDGFRDAQLHDSVTSVRDGISSLSTQLCNCCGDMQLGLANGFNGVNNSIFGAQSAITAQLNANELASLNRSFAEQTANTQGFTNVQAQLAQNGYNQATQAADIKYTIATENCADRYEAAQNTRDIIDSQTRGTQAILDKLCALELDGVKSQLAQAQRDNVALQNAVNMSAMRESQTAQTAAILQGQNNEIDALYNRLKNCPVNTVPVYGNQPIFTCPQSTNTCGCGNNF
jgi:hypothetical protein